MRSILVCLCLLVGCCHGNSAENSYIPDIEIFSEIYRIKDTYGDGCNRGKESEESQNCQDFWRTQLRAHLIFEGVDIKKQEETMEVMKEHCEFKKPTPHGNFMFPYSSGYIRCKVPSEDAHIDLEYTLCHKEGIDFCKFQGLMYDFGLVDMEFPAGSGKRIAWAECCSCMKHFE